MVFAEIEALLWAHYRAELGVKVDWCWVLCDYSLRVKVVFDINGVGLSITLI